MRLFNRRSFFMVKRIVQAIEAGILIVGLLQASDKKPVENFTLSDVNGVRHSLSDFRTSKAIVLMFIATQCPVSNAYNVRMAKLYEDYAPKGIAFIGINSNKQENVEEIKRHARDHGFGFSILKDWNNVIADRLGASVTPEIYVLNPKLEILYHGRIDDSRREANVKSNDLRNALDAVLAGKAIPRTETKAFGCTIKRVDR
jgi:peroxiredoxin